MNTIYEIENRILPSLCKIAEEISEEFPNVKVEIYSSPVGSLTDYQDYNLGLDCFLTGLDSDQADNLALSIGFGHLTTTPQIDEVGVGWGDPSGHSEADLFSEPVDVSEVILNELEAGLPQLYDSLEEALRRGQPRRGGI